MGTRGKRERRKEKNRVKRDARTKSRRLGRLKQVGLGLVLAGAIVGGVFAFVVTSKTLPPTSFGPGHLESLPTSQISLRPIDPLIQQHVMERNATHPNGQMLIQYNCRDYECEPGLESALEEIVTRFPPTVYLAPYPGMDAMIALAAPGRLEILDELDEDRIVKFIRDNLNR